VLPSFREGAVAGHAELLARKDSPEQMVWLDADVSGLPVFEREMVVVDVETTGLDPYRDEIIEFGAVLFRGDEVLDEFQTFVRPSRPIPPFITSLTGITNAHVENAPGIGIAFSRFLVFVAGRPLIAHNAPFDMGFINAASQRLIGMQVPNPVLCSLKLSRHLLPGISHSLGELAGQLEIPAADRHRALGDSRTTHLLWNRLLADPIETYRRLLL
jgi:DNA polymerase III epsilon subunit family exonuclease